jgi:hypothetical protein
MVSFYTRLASSSMARSQVRKVCTREKRTDAGYVSYHIAENACPDNANS